MDLNDIERLVAAEQRPHGNQCGTCEWLESLPPKTRQKWHDILWDGRDDSTGQLLKNKRWDTQAIQRAIVKLTPAGFPKSSVEGHRKNFHETPGIEA